VSPTILLSPPTVAQFGAAIQAACGGAARFAVSTPAAPLAPEALAAIDCAVMTLDVIGPSSKTVLSPEFAAFARHMAAAPGLRWLHIPAAGADRPEFQQLLARGVRVTTSSGANAEAVAHTALMGVMLLARNGLRFLHAQRQHQWQPVRGAMAPADLAGQTALVLGQGPIGRRIGELLRALGLEVLGLRRAPVSGDAERGIHAYTAIGALAPRVRWLIVACPLSSHTQGLVSAAVLAAMPGGSHVVNVGRGGVVDEAALLAALQRGHIAGAHLDVFETEPLPADSPFWDLPNVLVSPHSAGGTLGHNTRAVGLFVDNLARWQRGEPLVNEVPARH